MREGGDSYGFVTQPGEVEGLANGDAFEAVDAEGDRVDVDR